MVRNRRKLFEKIKDVLEKLEATNSRQIAQDMLCLAGGFLPEAALTNDYRPVLMTLFNRSHRVAILDVRTKVKVAEFDTEYDYYASKLARVFEAGYAKYEWLPFCPKTDRTLLVTLRGAIIDCIDGGADFIAWCQTLEGKPLLRKEEILASFEKFLNQVEQRK